MATLATLVDALPEHLRERCITTTPLTDVPDDRSLVVYWTRVAARGHENPALDVAIAASNRLGARLLVYHGLDERYPYASDRIHTFVLEGARDLSEELAARGIPYALHARREGHREDALLELAARSALVVTDHSPVEPLRGLTDRVEARVDAPLLRVDASCLVPMTLSSRAPARAYAFRKATKAAREARITRAWEELEYVGEGGLPELGFEPVAIDGCSISELVARCAIDHAIAPVTDTPGGSRAGYARWEAFASRRLSAYARHRNDASRHDGPSRMSAYLHFGHVSPMRLAREAHANGSEGAQKFLDELLTWRELAHHWCHHTEAHDTLEALPAWARETLERHADDERPMLYTREELSRAKTGDRIWNLAQTSLVRHGELHNHFRMTWGKQLLSWTRDPARALDLLVDLNHRYALDGRDPGSYSGILWCLGLFDRPHEPERPIFGSVRRYGTDHYGERLKIEAYTEVVERPLTGGARVAVVGAGMTGAALARALEDHGVGVTVFDKGYAPGGRTSSRRDPVTRGWFDHGAQLIRPESEPFRRMLRSWMQRGVVARWRARFGALEAGGDFTPSDDARPAPFVSTPHGHSLVQHVLAGVEDVHAKTRVSRVERRGGDWWLSCEDGSEHGPFGALALTTPAAQAVALLDGVETTLSEELRALERAQQPSWALMLEFDAPLELAFDAATVSGSEAIAWIARESSRPGRDEGSRWVAHATREWTRANLEREREEVAPELTRAFLEAAGRAGGAPSRAVAHRWRYALGGAELPERCLFDAEASIVVAGDWCVDGLVEGAYLSGQAGAGRLLGELVRRERERTASHNATQESLF